jgi:hypothetical protein
LKLEINNLITRKQKALFSKEYNKGKIRNSSSNNLDNNENELSQQLNLLKNENIIKNEHIKEKENQIEILKNAIDKVSLAMKTNEPQVAIQKMDITNLISDIENSENKSNLEEENNIKEQIKQMIAKNYQKSNEIHQLSQKYKKIINQKNLEINNLDMQLNQININNNLPMNNINPNLYSKVKVDSINELTLDDAYGQNNLNDILNDENGFRNIYANLNNENNDINEQNEIHDLGDFNEEMQNSPEEQFNQLAQTANQLRQLIK